MSIQKELLEILERVGRTFVKVRTKETTKWDSLAKVKGSPIYVYDVVTSLKDKKPVFVKTVRSTMAHAILKEVDIRDALAYPGVIKVLSSKDIPGVNNIGVAIPDEELLASRKVRYFGDDVALVVADSMGSAEEAAEKVDVVYEPLETYMDATQIVDLYTLQEKKHILIHDERGSDIIAKHAITVGNIEKALKQATTIVENTYETSFQDHAYLEPEVAIAIPEADGSYTIYVKAQDPFQVQRMLSPLLGISPESVRVIVKALGGGFGAASDVGIELAAKAALAAYHVKRPAVLIYDRYESFLGHTKRHKTYAWYRHAASKDGRLLSVEGRIVLDHGAYTKMGLWASWRSIVHSIGPYKLENADVKLVAVYTNNIPAGAFRGYGSPNVIFPIERQMDILAEELGLDPVEFRLKNILRVGDRTVYGQVLEESVGLEETILRATELANWKSKREEYSRSRKGPKRLGIGIAIYYHGNSLGGESVDTGRSLIEIDREGNIIISTSYVDMGQGSYQSLISIAAEVLEIPPQKIRIEYPDTSKSPDGGPTVASRVSYIGGAATAIATYRLKERLKKLALEMLGCSKSSDVTFEYPRIYCRDKSDYYITYRELVERAHQSGVQLREIGTYIIPIAEWDHETGKGVPYKSYTFGTVITEVEVDIETMEVKVLRAISVHDAGTIIDRKGAELMTVGGYIQGLGYALMEEMAYDGRGRPLTTDFSKYHVPTALDAPFEVVVDFVEKPTRYSAFGAKTLGEPPLIAVAPSILNAISHAVGSRELNMRLNRIPATPDFLYSLLSSTSTSRIDRRTNSGRGVTS